MLNRKKLVIYLFICLGISLVSIAFLRYGTTTNLIINALYIGGLFVVSWGLFLYVIKLGFFDVLVFSMKKLKKYPLFRKKANEQPQEAEPYYLHDYVMEKEKNNNHREPLIAGAFFTLLSILLTVKDTLVK